MMEYTADEIIKRLGMQPHREGGWYRFVWKNEQTVAEGALGDRYKGERSVCSLIYYLLKEEEVSRWHQLKSPEIWTWHCGDSLVMTLGGEKEEPDGNTQVRIGDKLDQGDTFQLVVPGGIWQTTQLEQESERKHGFALVSCIVSPAFTPEDCYLPDPLF